MKKFITALLAIAMMIATQAPGTAAERDILDLSLNRDAAVSVKTNNNILMSFGGHLRFIPTSETDWDFGMSDNAKGGYLGGKLNSSFFKNHVNESGWINNEYIRTETRLNFNAVSGDEKWSFFAALEFDRPLDTASVDERGGKTDDHSDYGLERLHATMALPFNIRLHTGWDIWGFDHGYAAGLVYADDNPGIWFTGGDEKLSWNFGYFKLEENNYQTSFTTLEDTEDSDRSLIAGYLTLKPSKEHKYQFFYGLDRIRNVTTKDLYGALTKTGIGEAPKTDSHHLGMYYNGQLGKIKLFGEAVYQFGEAEGADLKYKDYDINAYALSGDIAVNLDLGIKLTPHLGFIYTSGDSDPNDDKLEGYNGINNVQRFSGIFGGENTILADTNFVFGSTIYGFIPEMYGNGTPIYTGGQPAFGALGAGRGDNPGMLMTSLGFSAAPKPTLSFKSNINSFWWNEDIMVKNFVIPGQQSKVDAGYAGTEWDNLVTVVLSKHTFIQGQAAFLFPGEVIEDVTEALGAKSDDTAMRLAAEIIWKF
ncbi:MAG: hypothetical protein H6680_06295 [Desulfobacteraceae bacterium]|nr:hypothetical protein [Desulfobacteraceae bacterium]